MKDFISSKLLIFPPSLIMYYAADVDVMVLNSRVSVLVSVKVGTMIECRRIAEQLKLLCAMLVDM